MALDVHGQAVGRFVTTIAIFLQGLEHDPIQVAAHQLAELVRLGVPAGGDARQGVAGTEPQARSRRFLFADQPADFFPGRFFESLFLQRSAAGE